ncbi:MAG: GGDEF domain-containing protein, partial [Acidimicrobiales bacterium]
MPDSRSFSNPNAVRFQAALVVVAIVITLSWIYGGATAAVGAGVGSLVLMALLTNWLISQVERLTGERFTLERDGTTFQVASGYAGTDVKELNEEYGRMGVRMRRNLKLRDDESQILELISADSDRFVILEAITLMLSNQFPGNRFRFATNDMGRLDSAERYWHVTESTEYDFGWILEATLDGVKDPDPDVINLACDLARLTLLKARDQRSLKYQADHDVLTGLLSRRAILASLDAAIASGEPLGLIYGDVDHFKQINDTLGHLAGDEMLVEVSRRIREEGAQSGLNVDPGRLGGDEYLCVIPGCSEPQMRTYVEAVGFAMNAPFELSAATTSASMSWGAAFHPGGADCNSSELLKEADVALYQVKRDGRNSFRIFDDELREWTEEQKRLESDLAMSINKRSGVHADFQPQFDANRQLVGFEALGRWYRQGVGPVPPDDFLPIAVERGLMADFDREMYRHVSHVLGVLRKAGQPGYAGGAQVHGLRAGLP